MSASDATGHGGSHEVENEMSQTRGSIFFGAILAASCLGTLSRAAEPEFCVSCSGPPAQYRCTFSGDAGITPKGGLQLFCITTLAREGGHESCAVDRQTAGACAGTPKVLALPAGTEPGGVAEETPPPAQPAPAAGAPAPPAPPSSGAPAPAADAPQPPQQADPSAETKTQTPASSKKWSEQSGAPKPAGNPAATAKSDPDENLQSAPATNAEPVEKAGKAVTDAAQSTGKALEKAGSAVGEAAKKTWKCLSTLFGDC
ncbi:MAG: hypothetical protein JNL45_14510 [Hyphomicrobium sp.]|jgi:hypothetical protein|nr:hypothetical protein [Hyphomicrobium sp.]